MEQSSISSRGRVREALVTPERFAKCKARLLPELRARGDAPPRQLVPGAGARATWWANLAQLLRTSDGGALVRGFCLYEVLPRRSRMCAWRGCFHAVVETRTPSGHATYTDPSEARREADAGAPYIFVPSSRAYASLTDAELLSGDWLVGSVLLGDARACDAALAYEQTRGRRASLVARTPEALVAKRRVAVRLLPHFGTWARLRALDEDPEALGELMGMPVHAPGAEADEADAVASWQAVASNPESYVSGVEGLKLELECREKLLAGTVSLETVRTRFFAYYDTTYHAMRAQQLEAVNKRLASLTL